MTLSELLVTLQNTANMVVTVKEGDKELIKFYAAGYEQVLAATLAREIDKTTVGNNQITVVLKGGVSA